MSRRFFLKTLAILGAGIGLPAAAKSINHIAKHTQGKLLQTSPIAGFQYHQGEALWAQLAQGAHLQLTREPENKFDPRAVRVDFNGQKLGYIPRLDNAVVSQLLDRGERIQAHIADLKMSDDPWKRVGVEVRWMI